MDPLGGWSLLLLLLRSLPSGALGQGGFDGELESLRGGLFPTCNWVGLTMFMVNHYRYS